MEGGRRGWDESGPGKNEGKSVAIVGLRGEVTSGIFGHFMSEVKIVTIFSKVGNCSGIMEMLHYFSSRPFCIELGFFFQVQKEMFLNAFALGRGVGLIILCWSTR